MLHRMFARDIQSFDPRLQARLFRRAWRRTRQMVRYRRLSLGDVPILFANSFPKSGTHLLTQVLQGFQNIGPAVDSGLPAVVTYNGLSGLPRPITKILADLYRLLPGDIAYGHLHASEQTVNFFKNEGVVAYFILRDPRDVVVSHVHYVTEMAPNHVHHRYYTENLASFEERLRTSITGIPDSSVPFPDIRERYEPYLEWLDISEVLTLKYEDFVLHQITSLERVYQHAVKCGLPVVSGHDKAISLLAANIDPQKSPTFRQGKIGAWRESFSEANKQVFKETCADLLIRLGYETHHDW